MMQISQISQHDSTWSTLHTCSQALLHNPYSSKPALLRMKQKQGSQTLGCAVRFGKYNKNTRNFSIYGSGAEPSLPPSGPPSNIISWIVTVAVALAIPLINYKWGPTLKKKIQSVMQTTEDVVEAVEKVAEEVEKVAEDIADDLPKGGKLREAVDFVENFAETAAKEAGAIDDFIDEVQEEEEKAKQKAEDELEKPPEKPNDELTPTEDSSKN